MNNSFHENGAFDGKADETNKKENNQGVGPAESKKDVVEKSSAEDLEEKELIAREVDELADKFKLFIAEARKFKKDSKKTGFGEVGEEDRLKEDPAGYARNKMYETMLADPLRHGSLALSEISFIALKKDLQAKKESLDKALKELENDRENLPKNDAERIRLDLAFHEKIEEFGRNRPPELPFIIPNDLLRSEDSMFNHLNKQAMIINNLISEGENDLKKVKEKTFVGNKKDKISEIEKKIEGWRAEAAAISSFWDSFPEISREFSLVSEKLGYKEKMCAYLKEHIDFNEKKVVNLDEAVKGLERELAEMKEKIVHIKAWEEFEAAHDKYDRGRWTETKKK